MFATIVSNPLPFALFWPLTILVVLANRFLNMKIWPPDIICLLAEKPNEELRRHLPLPRLQTPPPL